MKWPQRSRLYSANALHTHTHTYIKPFLPDTHTLTHTQSGIWNRAINLHNLAYHNIHKAASISISVVTAKGWQQSICTKADFILLSGIQVRGKGETHTCKREQVGGEGRGEHRETLNHWRRTLGERCTSQVSFLVITMGNNISRKKTKERILESTVGRVRVRSRWRTRVCTFYSR